MFPPIHPKGVCESDLVVGIKIYSDCFLIKWFFLHSLRCMFATDTRRYLLPASATQFLAAKRAFFGSAPRLFGSTDRTCNKLSTHWRCSTLPPLSQGAQSALVFYLRSDHHNCKLKQQQCTVAHMHTRIDTYI